MHIFWILSRLKCVEGQENVHKTQFLNIKELYTDYETFLREINSKETATNLKAFGKTLCRCLPDTNIQVLRSANFGPKKNMVTKNPRLQQI